jgi:hypothetical protein
LVLSSGTGVSSVAQIKSSSKWLVILTTVLGVMSAFVTSLQRYMQYSERAEKARYLAKNYGRIATKIEDFLIFIESGATKVDEDSFNNFIKEVHKEIETLTQEADDMPATLRSSPEAFNDKLEALSAIELNIVRAAVNKGRGAGMEDRDMKTTTEGQIAGLRAELTHMRRSLAPPPPWSRQGTPTRSRSLDNSPIRGSPSPPPGPLPQFPRNAMLARQLAGSSPGHAIHPRRQTPPKRVGSAWK